MLSRVASELLNVFAVCLCLEERVQRVFIVALALVAIALTTNVHVISNLASDPFHRSLCLGEEVEVDVKMLCEHFDIPLRPGLLITCTFTCTSCN